MFFGRTQYFRMLAFAASEIDNAVTIVLFKQYFVAVKDEEKEVAARKNFDDKVAVVLEHVLNSDGTVALCSGYVSRITRDLKSLMPLPYGP